MLTRYLANEGATVNTGAQLGKAIGKTACIVHLEGSLGAGKTTLCRGVLNSYGYSAAVKSPTYTLVEPYQMSSWTIYHFDLYRLADPEELEFIGVRDYFSEQATCLVEWAERGGGVIPLPDLIISLSVVERGRELIVNSKTSRGVEILTKLKGETFES